MAQYVDADGTKLLPVAVVQGGSGGGGGGGGGGGDASAVNQATQISLQSQTISAVNTTNLAVGTPSDAAWDGVSPSTSLISIQKYVASKTSGGGGGGSGDASAANQVSQLAQEVLISNNTLNTSTSSAAIKAAVGLASDAPWDGVSANPTLISIQKHIAAQMGTAAAPSITLTALSGPGLFVSAATNYVLAPMNTSRRSIMFFNNSTANMWISFTGPAYASGSYVGIILYPGAVFSDTPTCSAAINIAADDNAAPYYFLEGN